MHKTIHTLLSLIDFGKLRSGIYATSSGICLLLVIAMTLLFSSCETVEKQSSEDVVEDERIPNDWFFRQRAFPQGQINKSAYKEALRDRERLKKSQDATRDITPEWTLCGPTNIGGRVVDVEMQGNSTVTMFVGTAAGGVFRSYDMGQSWEAIFDDQPSLSIGDMAIAPSETNRLYVGTGEANAGGGSLAYDGLGVFKSEDGGDSWEDIGLTDVGSIGKIVVDPQDPDRLYVAAMGDLFGNNPERGAYRSEDGGDSWEQVLYISDSTGVIDLAIHPQNGDIVYAATWERIRRPNLRKYGGPTCGIYKTEDGGDTWVELENNGLPATNKGRIGIAIANSNPDVLYAIYANQTGNFKGLYKSTDGGDNWVTMPEPTPNSNDFYSSFGWWFGKIFVDPSDENTLFTCGIDLFKSTDGANSWENVSGDLIHVDQHAIYIHPQNPDLVLCGNDGGMHVSMQGGDYGTWEHFANLPITQFYTCEIDESNPQNIYGGTQDNSSMRSTDGSLDNWEVIYFGDGFVVMVDPVDNSYVYTEYQYGNFARSTSGGAPFTFSGATTGISPSDRRNWNTPVVFDPGNPEILYYGANRLYRSDNRADSWTVISDDLTNGPSSGNLPFNTITTIAVSAADGDIIYTGADDGSVYVTTNGGDDWAEIDADLPERWVTKVASHPTDPQVAYVAISGFRYNESLPHVYKTNNQGANWESISNGLPDVPVNDLILDPENEGWIYLATDIGVFVSFTDGGDWSFISDGLPNVPVTDIDLHNDTRSLLAATYGRSMYKASLDELSDVGEPTVATDIGLEVYPNPLTDESRIYLDWPVDNHNDFTLEIVDVQGRILHTIFKGVSSTGKYVYALPELDQSGTYFCVLKTSGQVISKAILKVK